MTKQSGSEVTTQPSFNVEVQDSFNVEVYIIPNSNQQQRHLESEINHDSVTVLKYSKYGMKAARRPTDGEMVIDLREQEKEETFYFSPSWW